MSEDPRCCGTGTCIINQEGLCWCGQAWDGEKMCIPTTQKTNIHQENENATDMAGHRTHSGAHLPHQLDH